jgi:hypothetical protein
MNFKAQADIVTAVIIIAIAIGLMSTAYMWGVPLIQKRQHEALAARVRGYFDQNKASSLPNRIEFIASAGRGEETFNIEADGGWVLNPAEDWIQFTFWSKASDISVGEDVSLTPGAPCPPPGSLPNPGYRGEDKASIVCANATKVADGFDIRYRIYFRQLNERDGTRSYKIDLVESEPLRSSTKSLRISFIRTTQRDNLITTEIKINL